MIGELEAAAADWLRNVVKHKPHPHGAVSGPCANCQTELQGHYCHNCGQSSDLRKRSILHLMLEALEGLFDLDGRLLRTLPALLFTPGKLARDYIEGRWARHVPPFRTFLVALLLFIFAAEHAIHQYRQRAQVHAAAEASRLATPQGRAAAAAKLRAEAVKDRDDSLKEAARERAKDLKSADDDGDRRGAEVDYAAETAGAQRAYDAAMARADKVEKGQASTADDTDTFFGADADKRREWAQKIRNGQGGLTYNNTAEAKPGHKASWLQLGLAKAVENPDYYLTVVFDWAHRLAILLLPVVGLSLALVYCYRRKFYLYDHLLVAMNLLSFFFLTSAVGLVLPWSLWPFWFCAITIWAWVNMFQTLRGGYGSSIAGAFLKTVVVWWITFTAFVSLMVTLLIFALSQV